MARVAVTGDDAVAEAAKAVNPDVVAAYPITPQTTLVEGIANYVASGEFNISMVYSIPNLLLK